jgi:hypothetical protein
LSNLFFLLSLKNKGKNNYMETKEVFSTRVNSSAIKALKHLAIDLHKSIGVLLDEAIQDLLKKYQIKPSPKKSPKT